MTVHQDVSRLKNRIVSHGKSYCVLDERADSHGRGDANKTFAVVCIVRHTTTANAFYFQELPGKYASVFP